MMNSNEWWNSGGIPMVWSGGHGDAALAASHEGGHGFFHLGDEYGDCGGGRINTAGSAGLGREVEPLGRLRSNTGHRRAGRVRVRGQRQLPPERRVGRELALGVGVAELDLARAGGARHLRDRRSHRFFDARDHDHAHGPRGQGRRPRGDRGRLDRRRSPAGSGATFDATTLAAGTHEIVARAHDDYSWVPMGHPARPRRARAVGRVVDHGAMSSRSRAWLPLVVGGLGLSLLAGLFLSPFGRESALRRGPEAEEEERSFVAVPGARAQSGASRRGAGGPSGRASSGGPLGAGAEPRSPDHGRARAALSRRRPARGRQGRARSARLRDGARDPRAAPHGVSEGYPERVEGYEIIADCLENPGAETSARAQALPRRETRLGRAPSGSEGVL